MFAAQGMKRRHVGAKTVLDDGEKVRHLLTDDTRRATDKAVWMQVKDVVAGAFNEAKFQTNVDKLKGLGRAADQRRPGQGGGAVAPSAWASPRAKARGCCAT